MTAKRKIHEGFRRIAIVVGFVGASAVVLGALIIAQGQGWGISVWLRVSLIAIGLFAICWGIVKLVGWIVEGFFSD